ncbi:hypothetical protein OIE69_44290 (plasmid) [Actinacidiphila glaucinigra]|uniref:hypothetical protein n=1 Tax=Actinacidiphila glaucinigra TaxID=235986 RepID=UPI002DDBB7E9|nr:hypothetical protein [Actinacidiphila glaucinigra]WSD65925.1 hypothetical protein OIE69_44290 [Actinacidiphila glaucinigra]
MNAMQPIVTPTPWGTHWDFPGDTAVSPAEERRRHLLSCYRDHLSTALDHETASYTISVSEGSETLAVELFDITSNEIVVVCPAHSRGDDIAYAIGALLDLVRFFTPAPNKLLVATGEPYEDTRQLLASCDITVCWPTDDGSFRRGALTPPEPGA